MTMTRSGWCRVAALAVVVAPATAAAQEQPDTFRLREVVVTATRLPTPTAAAPGTVTVLTRTDLTERGIRFVADALRLVPGVAVIGSAGPGSQTSVFMRGGESDYVQVLVDGVQVNQPGGAYDWAHLRADDIERIEVVRGPASVLYGSDAVSGVVQIFTRSGGRPRIEANASSAHGSRYTGDAAYVTNALDLAFTGTAAVREGATVRYGLSAAHLSSTGLYERHSDYDNTHVAGRVQYVGSRADAALSARRGDNEFWYPTTGSGTIVEREQFATGETLTLALDAGHRVLPRLEARLLATSHAASGRTESPPSDLADDSFWSTSEITRRRIDGRLNALLPAAVLTIGAERQWQRAVTALESQSSFGPWSDESDHERGNVAGYAQLHGTPVPGLSLTLGARLDDNDVFGTFRTGRAALSLSPRPATRLHAAVGTAFKEPTFFETYAQGFTRGNPELRPERARSGEAGVEHALLAGTLTLGATWFHQRFGNLIQYTAAPAPEAPNYVNVGAASARGIEVSARGGRAAFSYGVTHAFTQTRVLDEGVGDDVAFQHGRRLLRRPEHVTTLSAGYRTDVLRLLLDARRVGERDDLDFTDPAEWAGIRTVLPAHATVNVAAEYALLRRGARTLDIALRVHNVLDAEYQEIYNFPTPGRVLQLSARFAVQPRW
jgi:vitamin B12 transporter